MRVMALDVGEKTVGVALSDELRITVNPFETIRRDGGELDRLQSIISTQHVTEIVVGLPLSLNGSEGPSTERARAFVTALRPLTTASVVTQDERLSTTEAERRLVEADVRRSRRRQVIDSVAAALILESYLARTAPPSSSWLDDED